MGLRSIVSFSELCYSFSSFFYMVFEELRCRRMYPLPYMSVNCTGTKLGSECSFSCDSNSELNGTDHTYCKRVHNKPYSMWDLEKKPFCQGILFSRYIRIYNVYDVI